MSFTERWKQAKSKYETSVKEKKPSEKLLGVFRKSTGIEPACKDLDAAIAKGKRSDGERALNALKRAGQEYLELLNRTLETESAVLKQLRTSTLKAMLDELLIDAHNAIKGLDNGVFETVLGPDIVNAVGNLKFPRDAFVKSFAANEEFKRSGATNQSAPSVAKAQADFARALQVASTAYTIFATSRGKTLQKSQILDIASRALDAMFDSVSVNGMLGQCAYWQRAQAEGFGPNRDGMAKFARSTPMQVLEKVAQTLNDDSVLLNGAKAKLKTLQV
jgi:hypothetical protein